MIRLVTSMAPLLVRLFWRNCERTCPWHLIFPIYISYYRYTNTLMVVLNQRIFTPSNNRTTISQTHSSDMEPAALYRARFSERNGPGGGTPKSFKDTFRAGTRDIPLAPINVRSALIFLTDSIRFTLRFTRRFTRKFTRRLTTWTCRPNVGRGISTTAMLYDE